ncbi:heme-binding protein [Nocardioides sp.]|uniref:GlcG/HbpS family heme-binding protein n=1 Tax=Nocardioides sp. TaxID=35761 RepID=UPI00352849AE
MSDYVAASASLTLAGARRVLDAALAHAGELGVAVNVSVCDVAGHEIAFVRMDGAALLSADVARDKAYTVAAFLGIPTERWFSMIEQEPAVREGIVHRDRLVIFAGGVPVLADGATVGAVGVSGGTAEQDQAVAAAGAAAIS